MYPWYIYSYSIFLGEEIMKYCGTLLSVADIGKAKDFYGRIMEQKILMDLGVHVSFEGGVSLQSNYGELLGVELSPKNQPDNFQLYFEVEDLDAWETKLSAVKGIDFLHASKEYPWGQRVFRFYDFDRYIVEVAESMVSVAKRFLAQGLSVEETSARTMFPIEVIKHFL